MTTENVALLRTYLAKLDSREIHISDVPAVERLLHKCWHEMAITSKDAGLESYKLLNRTESMTWNAPRLTFDIERHGATVAGSVYADVYSWSIDLDRGTATMNEQPVRRQVGKKQAALKVQPLAAELAALILKGESDQRLIWKGNAKVRVVIADVIPETNAQTTSSRRKRFRAVLQDELRPRGWQMTTINTFELRAVEVTQ